MLSLGTLVWIGSKCDIAKERKENYQPTASQTISVCYYLLTQTKNCYPLPVYFGLYRITAKNQTPSRQQSNNQKTDRKPIQIISNPNSALEIFKLLYTQFILTLGKSIQKTKLKKSLSFSPKPIKKLFSCFANCSSILTWHLFFTTTTPILSRELWYANIFHLVSFPLLEIGVSARLSNPEKNILDMFSSMCACCMLITSQFLCSTCAVHKNLVRVFCTLPLGQKQEENLGIFWKLTKFYRKAHKHVVICCTLLSSS